MADGYEGEKEDGGGGGDEEADGGQGGEEGKPSALAAELIGRGGAGFKLLEFEPGAGDPDGYEEGESVHAGFAGLTEEDAVAGEEGEGDP